MAEEREVVARLKTEKTGDTGAFKDAAEDVRDLKEEATAAAPAVENLGEAASEAGDAAGDAGKGLGEMGKAGEGAGKSLGDVKTQALAAAAAFQAGYELGTQLRGILNDLTKGGFDRGIQAMVTSIFDLDEGLDSSADAAQRMMNGMRILKANGIDPVGLSAAEVEKKVAELAKAKNDAAKASEDLTKAEGEWAEKLGLSGKALDESSKKLAQYIADFAKQNSQLSQTDLAKIFGPMIQDVLDAYARLGKEAPAEVAKLASGWGVLTTAAQKAANEQSKIVDDMVADITGAAAGLKGSLEAQLKTLNEVFSKLNFGNMGAEQIEKAKTFLQQYVDLSLKAGQQIPKDVADQAAALGILVPAMNVASTAASSFAGHQTDVADKTVHTTQVFDAHGKELSHIATVSDTAGTAAKTAGTKIKEGADEAGKGKKPLEDIAGVIHTAKGDFEIAASSAKTMGEAVKSGSEKAGEGKTALGEAGKAAGDAGTGLDAAKKGAEGLGAAGDAAKTAATNLKTPLAEVGTAAGDAATALGSINEIKFAGANSEITTLLSNLDLIVTKANAAKAALDAIDDDSAGSGGGGGGGF